jgi:hypothetical protein
MRAMYVLWNNLVLTTHGTLPRAQHIAMTLGIDAVLLNPFYAASSFASQPTPITMGQAYSETERHDSPGHLLNNRPHKLGPLARLALSGRRARLGDTGRGFLLPCQHSGVSRRTGHHWFLWGTKDDMIGRINCVGCEYYENKERPGLDGSNYEKAKSNVRGPC